LVLRPALPGQVRGADRLGYGTTPRDRAVAFDRRPDDDPLPQMQLPAGDRLTPRRDPQDPLAVIGPSYSRGTNGSLPSSSSPASSQRTCPPISADTSNTAYPSVSRRPSAP